MPAADRVWTRQKRIRQLIADLDSRKFATRDAASKELQRLGTEAEPALNQILKSSPSLELRRRVEAILAAPPLTLPPEPLRELRALEVLEHIGSPEARQVLKLLATGIPEARLTQEAKAALARLAERH